ncbi:MAG: TetR/AcrR family transcriptional regulator C-terminal domain-containing protein [Streptosporangiaceae bacterium]|nr:TetR/AcrR family transcriptional regulator C-terminal domain-containing protein [Streptosporangiaceae bacterium]MBV9854139.1 TetR/AcrR family transcriptional regulator C-terminal domain-containing protein [Streptosporangiaceae bacterium]
MDTGDEDLWLSLRPLPGGPARRDQRGRERDRRVHEHISRHREHGSRPSRRTGGLTRAQIVAAAITVADAEGTEAVSMRRIARELRAGAMSLYWHVASKEELHSLMLEAIQAEAQAPGPSGDWRADLAAFARNTRAALRRHPWAIDFLGNGPPSGPNEARNAERMLAALDALGVDIVTGLRITETVSTYVFGAALREIQEIRCERIIAEWKATLTEAEIKEFVAEMAQKIRQSGRYPHILRIMEEDIDPDAPETRDERFEFGLTCVLDGIAATLPAR